MIETTMKDMPKESFSGKDGISKLDLLNKDVDIGKIDIQDLDKPFSVDGLSDRHKVNDEKADASEKIHRSIICRNKDLEGDVHPITGVPFERKTIEVNGECIDGVFPEFDSFLDVPIPSEMWEDSDKKQFSFAMKKLQEAIDNDPELRGQFTEEQLEQIENGDVPDGCVWHHSENPGELQLIDKDTHDKTGHTGGRAVWGGGSDNR